MFPYDSAIVAAVRNQPQTILDVLQGLRTIDGLCVNEDGLKWFNGLYLTVTQAIESRVNGGEFQDPAWIAQLDVLTFSDMKLAVPITGARRRRCIALLQNLQTEPANLRNPA